ncbi:MFS transporter [Nocardioides marmoriginsengisoli]|uniref:MFS transporter n=1 Tax=Nocardioides marmoriginsengisoli TaxID=661483 RepID=A0A3N0CN36_9ACTN|nr:MFS transporter [Nocardioides marmoriginsengisoli]RNL64872.1 MFS transporter [Nocardioides marmoriginsengisoli]
MLDSYRRVFAHPGSASFSATGLIARLPISMMTLGIVILVSTLSGSYGLAGQVSAAFVIGNAVVAIAHGRLADRFGQTRVLYVDAVVFALATGLLVHSVTADWANPVPHLFAALSGAAMPQIGSMVRARWANLVSSDQERHTAFAVEAVVDELVFVTGPGLVTFLSTLYAPQTGLLVALALGTVGTVVLALQTRTAPPAHPVTRETKTDPLPWGRLVPIALAAIAMGCLFGALEVATVAVAEDDGHKAASGALLGVFALGSMGAGIVAGAIHWKSSDLRRFQGGIALLAPAMLVLPFVSHLVPLGLVLFVIGTALAPTLIAIVSLLEGSTPRSRLTEAMAVFQTGISGGIAPGAYLAGVVADHAGGSPAYWVCAGAAGFALIAALSCRPAPVAD